MPLRQELLLLFLSQDGLRQCLRIIGSQDLFLNDRNEFSIDTESRMTTDDQVQIRGFLLPDKKKKILDPLIRMQICLHRILFLY